MRFVFLLPLALPLAAAAQQAPPSPAEPPRAVPQRVFIAPSGEPFRAPVDAPYPLVLWFAGADHNHDGRLDPSEFTWDFDRFFDTLDTDHDGVVDAREIDRYERAIAPEVNDGGLGGGGDVRGGASGGLGRGDREREAQPDYIPRGGGSRYELIAIPEPVSSMDTGRSGAVTRAELHAAAARRFALLDDKQRGYLILADLPEPDAVHNRKPSRRQPGEHRPAPTGDDSAGPPL